MIFLEYTTETWTIVDTGSTHDFIFTTPYKCMISCELIGSTSASGRQTLDGRVYYNRQESGVNAWDGLLFESVPSNNVANPTGAQFKSHTSVVESGRNVYAHIDDETGSTRSIVFHIFRLPESP